LDSHGADRVSEPYLALRIVMMPRDANPIPTVLPGFGPGALYGTIFGGVILSYIDMAGAISAGREVALRGGREGLAYATVAINRVEFKKPVLVGDVVSFRTSCVKIGRTSITMHINVEAERGREAHAVTEAEVVYVGVDPSRTDRPPTPLLPGLAP
jgi:acyl-CoA thioesterase YciA